MRMVVAAALAMLAPALALAGPPDCTCAAPLLFVRISAPA